MNRAAGHRVTCVLPLGQDGRVLIGPHLPPENVPLIRLAVERTGAAGEEVLAVLGCVRARSEVSVLALTTRRLLTLGRPARDYPLVEEFFHGDGVEVQVERDSLLTRGRVRVRIADQVRVLGSLTPTGDDRAIAILDRGLAGVRLGESADRPALPAPGMPTIPVPRPPAGGPSLDDALADERPEDHAPAADRPADLGRHPLVAHLAELAGLHRAGFLTDEEFASAKARLVTGS